MYCFIYSASGDIIYFLTFFLIIRVRKIYTVLGLISLALGIIGVLLPLLPTTPFVLLAAGLFAKGSTRLHHWLINHRLFGKLIKDFDENKIIPLHAKIIAISMLWISILYAIIIVAEGKLWLQIILASIAIAVTIHISRYKSHLPKSNG